MRKQCVPGLSSGRRGLGTRLILGAENVHELTTILCSGKLQTLKFTDQQTWVCSIHTKTGNLEPLEQNEGYFTICVETRNILYQCVLDSYYPHSPNITKLITFNWYQTWAKWIWWLFTAFCVLIIASKYLKHINSYIVWVCIRQLCCLKKLFWTTVAWF